MARKPYPVTLCLAVLLLLLGACGGEEAPSAAAPGETASPEPDATEEAPAPPALDTQVYEFPQGTELLAFEAGGPSRNPAVVATDEGFRWGALVARDGEVKWVVDGVKTPIEEGELTEFAVSGDLSRYAYVSDDVVVVDGRRVEHDGTGCCPTFSHDGSRFGYIADGSFVVLDGVPQETHPDGVGNLVLSDDGSRYAYVVEGNTVVLDGQKQTQYESVSTLTFSPDGSRFAYVADENTLVVDGEESEIGESLAEQIAFSPDGSRLAYVMGDLKSGRVVMDEKEQKRHRFGCPPEFLKWTCIAITSDGSSVAYLTTYMPANMDTPIVIYRVVRDGVQDRNSAACCLAASLEGSHVAFVSSRRGVVVDGQPQVGMVSVPEQGFVAVGDVVIDTEAIVRTPADLVFSGDGRNLAFLLFDGGESRSSITRLYLEILEVP